MSFEGIAIGDLHFDKPNLAYFEDPLSLQLKALRRAYNYASREGIQHIFYLGDICEFERLSEEARVAFLRLLFKYDDFGFHQYIILGNHDYQEKGVHSLQTLIELEPRFKHLTITDSRLVVPINGVDVELLSFPHKKASKNIGVAFAHYEVHGAKSDSGRVVEDKEKMYENECEYIQGHLHTPQRVRNHWYPGTLYQLSFGESMPKGFGRFTVKNSAGKAKLSKAEHIQTEPPFQLINIRAKTREDLNAIQPSDTIKYKLFAHDDLVLPQGFLDDHPNIVNSLKFRSEKELASMEREEFLLSDGGSEPISIDDALPKYLKSVGHSSKEVAECVSLLQKLKDENRD